MTYLNGLICPSDLEINCSDSECDSLSKNSYDSTIKPSKRLKINVLEPDSESDFENEWIACLNTVLLSLIILNIKKRITKQH